MSITTVEPLYATCFAGESVAYCDSFLEAVDFAVEAAKQGLDTTVRYANGVVNTWTKSTVLALG